MENEDINKILLEDDYFEILYPNQNYKETIEYKHWKKIVTEKNGINGKEIYCKKDNIILYQKYEENNNVIKCPICKTLLYKCKYCKRILNKKTTRCCFRAYLNEVFKNKDIYQYIKYKKNEDKNEFYQIFFCCFIPLFFAAHILLISLIIFFYNLENKKGIIINTIIEDSKKRSFIIPYRIFSNLFLLLMSLVYTIFFNSIYFTIIIFSLPFKLYPIKIILGFFYSII